MTIENLQMISIQPDQVNGPSGADISKQSSYAAMEAHPVWPMVERLPVKLGVCIPVQDFKVCDLLDLASGRTLTTSWAVTEDVPLKTDSINICWGEFEVVEQRIAIRLTRLA